MGAKITAFDNGPLKVEGDLEVCDQDGSSFGLEDRAIVFLCRCGHSANKPFCDGAHKRVGFESSPRARPLPPPGA